MSGARSSIPPIGYVFVVRDPDASNEITAIGCAPEIIDIDLGNADLHDDDEWAEWLASHVAGCNAIADEKAREYYEQTLCQVAENFGHAEPTFTETWCLGCSAVIVESDEGGYGYIGIDGEAFCEKTYDDCPACQDGESHPHYADPPHAHGGA